MTQAPLRPNLFIIGAMKSGTTSLHEYLDTHPQIAMSQEKEPGYFVEELGLHKGEEWYLSRWPELNGAASISRRVEHSLHEAARFSGRPRAPVPLQSASAPDLHHAKSLRPGREPLLARAEGRVPRWRIAAPAQGRKGRPWLPGLQRLRHAARAVLRALRQRRRSDSNLRSADRGSAARSRSDIPLARAPIPSDRREVRQGTQPEAQ